MANKIVFYAWQAQRPGKCNRYLIEEALERALKELAQDNEEPVEFTLDQDARGVLGSPEISTTILRKIEDCAVFVADVTPVGSLINGKSTPNPNVLFELGYAWRTIGENRVILVLNDAFGSPEDLPFDISKRSLVRYRLDDTSDRRGDVRTGLVRRFRSLLYAMARDDHLRPLREGGLNTTDIALFKAAYAKMLEDDTDICPYQVVLQVGNGIGLDEEGVNDAAQMISDLGLWKTSPVMGPHLFSHIRAETPGMERYCQAFVSEYHKLPEDIGRRIINGMTGSMELVEAVGKPEIVVEHVLKQLQDNDYINITERSSAGIHVLEAKPKLKRIFHEG